MGYYIQTSGNKGKAQEMIARYGGEIIYQPPASYNDIPEGKALIVIIDNGPFEAAGFCFSEQEFEAFTRPEDKRRKWYILMDRETAEKESGYSKRGK